MRVRREGRKERKRRGKKTGKGGKFSQTFKMERLKI